jgi:hypothetical protein
MLDDATSLALQEAIDRAITGISELAEGYARDYLPQFAQALADELAKLGYRIEKK